MKVLPQKYHRIALLIFILFIFAGSAAIRFYSLRYDMLPVYRTAAVLVDEGYKAYNARNLVLWKNNFLSSHDDYKGWHKRSPVVHKLYTGWFHLWGVSKVKMRIFSVIFSMASLFLLLLLGKFYKNSPAFYVPLIVLAAFSHINIQYGRLGLIEIPATTFFITLLILILLLFKNNAGDRTSLRNRMLIWPGIGLSVLILLFTKASMLIPLGSMLFGIINIISLPFFRGSAKKRGVILLSEYSAILLTLLLLCSVPELRSILSKLRPFTTAKSFILFFLNGKVFNLHIIRFSGMIFAMTLSMSCLSIIQFIRSQKQTYNEQFNFLLANIFILTFLLVSALDYHPLRYYYIIYPIMFFFSGSFLYNLVFIRKTASKLLLLIPLTLCSVIQIFWHIYLIRRMLSLKSFSDIKSTFSSGEIFINTPSFLLLVIALFVCICAVFYAITKPMERNPSRLFISTFLCIQLSYLLLWNTYKSDELYRISRHLPELVGHDSSIAGDWAPVLVLDNKLKAYNIDTSTMKTNMNNLKKLKPDYLIVRKNTREHRMLKKRYPYVFRRRAVAEFHVYKDTLMLLEF